MSYVQSERVNYDLHYGSFNEHAQITQGLKGVMACTPNWAHLAHDQKEALDMIAHKIGYILNGELYCEDTWRDISEYAFKVYDRLSNGVQS